MPIRTSPRRELQGIDAYNMVNRGSEQSDDELERYLREESAPTGTEPLGWWKDHQHKYPVLRRLAFTLLAAPASTASVVRLFSMAGNVINQQRPHTKEDLAEAVQCLRS